MDKANFLGKIHEAIVQMLYAFEVGKSFEEKELVAVLMQELKVSRSNLNSAYAQALAIWNSRFFFDSLIEQHSIGYSVDRIGEVEKAILRFALAEWKEGKNEQTIFTASTRMVKKFSTSESAKYVRAVLDAIIKAGKKAGKV